MAILARNQRLLLGLFLLVVASPLDVHSATGRPLVTISKETTYITEPLRPDGYPDYLAALNQQASKGVTPENNAAVLLVQALGPKLTDSSDRKPLSREYCEEFFTKLGIAPPPEKGDYFICFDDYVKKHAPDAIKDRDDTGKWRVPRSYDESERAWKRPWSKEECPLVAGWLAENEKPLLRIVEASRRPRFYVPAILGRRWGVSMDGVVLPLVSPLKNEVAKALEARAMLRIHEGNVEQAWEDLQTCRRLARLETQGATSDESICATGIEGLATYGELQLARFGRLTSEQAGQYRLAVGRLSSWTPTLDKIARTRRLEYLDSVCAAASGRGKAGDLFGEHLWHLGGNKVSTDPNTTLETLVASGRIDWDKVLRLGHEHFDKILAAAHKSTWSEREKALDVLCKELSQQAARYRKELKATSSATKTEGVAGQSSLTQAVSVESLYCSPGWNPVSALWMDRFAVTRATLVETAFGICAYRADRGHYPKKLNELVPRYLAGLPEDPYGTGVLQYRCKGDSCVLYSVGRNGVDDAGVKPFTVALVEVGATTRTEKNGGNDDEGIGMAEPSVLERLEREAEEDR